MSNSVLLSAITLTLLLPALWRRHERRRARAGGDDAPPVARRRGRVAVALV